MEKKDSSSFESSLENITKFIQKFSAEREFIERSQKKVLKDARKILADMKKKEERILKKIESILEGHALLLSEILKVNRNVDETLCNVLLAIRQNEYLQAWYPAQNGQPEQRVVGKYVATEPEDVV